MATAFPFHLEYRASCGRWTHASCGPFETAEAAQAQLDAPHFMGHPDDWRVRRHEGRYVYEVWAKDDEAQP